jgi:hypothetical protein
MAGDPACPMSRLAALKRNHGPSFGKRGPGYLVQDLDERSFSIGRR